MRAARAKRPERLHNGKTTIISPTFDLRGAPPGGAALDFACWFALYSQPDDALRLGVSSDGGQSFNDFLTVTSTVVPWQEVRNLPLPGPCTGQMKIRFWLADRPNNSVVDALIDDVRVGWVDDHLAALRAQTRMPAPGTMLRHTLQAPREPGAPYVFAIAFTRGPTVLPGIGRSGLGLPIFPVLEGSLDAGGNAAFQVALPAAPGLKGLRVHTEAFVAGPAWIFSNLWTIVISSGGGRAASNPGRRRS